MKTKQIASIKKGFSIGEVILSVFILGVTMVTILSIYVKSIKELQDERDSVIAAMLSQEGIELARNIRDNNWAARECAKKDDCILSGDDFPDTFENFYASDNDNCRVDINSSDITSCGTSKALNTDNTSGHYVHSAGAATKFRRNITLDYINGDKDLVVTSLVSWDNDNPEDVSHCTVINKCTFSQSTLTDWGTGT